MQLNELIRDVDGARLRGSGQTQIAELTIDSRKVAPGALYICIPGTRVDGHAFVPQAQAAGAAAILCEREMDTDLPQVIVPDARRAMSTVAANFYGRPAQGMKLLAVTGTNGKTSTTYMLKSIAQAAGFKVGLIGTIAVMIGEQTIPSDMTTPDPIELQRLLRQMADAGVDLVAMEASAHALYLRKLEGIRFAAAAFTNLTQDHLDFFGDMAHYLKAKARLFEGDMCEKAVFNLDDEAVRALAQQVTVPKLTFSIEGEADLVAKDVEMDVRGSRFTLQEGDRALPVFLRMPGLFAVHNALTAAGLARAAGIGLEDVARGLDALSGVAGRFEVVEHPRAPFSVIVDYAHTPDGLQNILSTARTLKHNRIITVFGCGGDRDSKKRPIMGQVAGELSDLCIATSDNPRTEDPYAILEMIRPGLRQAGKPYEMIENRMAAIERAIALAQDGDIVIIAGKGHEDYQIVGTQKHHFDDRQAAHAALDARFPVR